MVYQNNIDPFFKNIDNFLGRSGESVHLITSNNRYDGTYSRQNQWAAHYYAHMGIFIGTSQQAKLASVLKVIPSQDYVVIAPSTVDKVGEKELEKLRLNSDSEAYYDTRAEDSVIGLRQGVNRFGRTYEKATYSGADLDKTFLLSYAKSSFVHNMSEAWQMTFLMDDYGRHGTITTLWATKALARALTLGEEEIFVPTGRGTGKKLATFQIDLLDECEIHVNTDDEQVAKALASTKTARDYAKIWQKQADAHHLSIRVSEKDLKDSDSALVIFKDAAKILGIAPLVNAYKNGVDVDDLVA